MMFSEKAFLAAFAEHCGCENVFLDGARLLIRPNAAVFRAPDDLRIRIFYNRGTHVCTLAAFGLVCFSRRQLPAAHDLCGALNRRPDVLAVFFLSMQGELAARHSFFLHPSTDIDLFAETSAEPILTRFAAEIDAARADFDKVLSLV